METPGKNVPLPPPPPPLISNIVYSETTQTSKSEQEDESISLSTNSDYVTENSHNAELERLVNKLFDWNSIDAAAVIVVSRNVQHVPQSGPK